MQQEDIHYFFTILDPHVYYLRFVICDEVELQIVDCVSYVEMRFVAKQVLLLWGYIRAVGVALVAPQMWWIL